MLEDVNNSYKMEAQTAMKIEREGSEEPSARPVSSSLHPCCVSLSFPAHGAGSPPQHSPGADEQHPKLGQGPSVVEPTPEALVATVRPQLTAFPEISRAQNQKEASIQ
jgi:hypothetical protein